jgi:transposase
LKVDGELEVDPGEELPSRSPKSASPHRILGLHVEVDGLAVGIRERTGAGRTDARKRGVRFGRPKKMNDEQLKLARRLLKEGKSIRDVARTFSIHPATLYRILTPVG